MSSISFLFNNVYFYSVVIDNIVDGKRVRTPKSSQSVINSPGRPGPSNIARRLIADG